MVNKPKAIGTAAETAVARFFQNDGWTDAERIALHGAYDKGDVRICSRPWTAIAEVKAGATAEAASPALIEQWLDETDTERRNAAATIGVLVVRRYRRNITAWDVWLPLKHLVWLEVGVYGGSDIPVRLSLGDFSELLRFAVGEWEAGDRP